MNGDDPRHGTAKLYKRGCRCDRCRRAQCIHQKRWLLGQTGSLIDGTGTRRRIQALAVLGWSYGEIGAACGVGSREWAREVMKHHRVHTDTALRVANAYEQMSMTIPDGKTRTRARLWAARQGWVPPLAYNDIDDPDEQPRDWHYTSPDRADALTDLDELGAGITTACDRLGVNRRALEKWCHRNDLGDVYSRLVARETPRYWANQHAEGVA